MLAPGSSVFGEGGMGVAEMERGRGRDDETYRDMTKLPLPTYELHLAAVLRDCYRSRAVSFPDVPARTSLVALEVGRRAAGDRIASVGCETKRDETKRTKRNKTK